MVRGRLRASWSRGNPRLSGRTWDNSPSGDVILDERLQPTVPARSQVSPLLYHGIPLAFQAESPTLSHPRTSLTIPFKGTLTSQTPRPHTKLPFGIHHGCWKICLLSPGVTVLGGEGKDVATWETRDSVQRHVWLSHLDGVARGIQQEDARMLPPPHCPAYPHDTESLARSVSRAEVEDPEVWTQAPTAAEPRFLALLAHRAPYPGVRAEECLPRNSLAE